MSWRLTLLITGMVRLAAGQVQILAVPATESELAGEWYKSKMSTVDFVNPSTGAHADPSGERLNVRFSPDGTFRLGWLLQSSLYNCSSKVFGYKVGVYRLSNSTIDMEVRSNTLTSKDTCHPEWNYEKHPPLGRSSYHLQLGSH